MDSDAGSVSSRASSPEIDLLGPGPLASRHNKLLRDFLSDREEPGGGRPPRASLRAGQGQKEMAECPSQELRLKVNHRERKRMQDLNVAMDGLREVMPYAHGPSVRKLSKIATLLLARNYILMLSGSLDEMKRLVSEVCGGQAHFHPPTCGQGGLLPLRPLATPPPSLPLGFLGIGRPSAPDPLKGSAPPPALPLSAAYRHWGQAACPCPCPLCQTVPQHLPAGHTANPSRPSANK